MDIHDFAGYAGRMLFLQAIMFFMSGCAGMSSSHSNETSPGGYVEETDSMDVCAGVWPVYWQESEVDERPQFPGGDVAMRRYFDECYRKEKDAIIGSASIGYIVNSKGKIEKPEIIEGDSLLGLQLIRIIEQFPDYIPGKKDGNPVDVYMTFSMSMSLKVGVDTIE